MIDNMVVILAKEQADDEKHTAFCTDEFGKSDDEKKATQEDLAAITATMESLADEIAGLVEDVKTLQEEIAALDKSVAEATEQRKEEHQDYTETLALTETAIELIGKAKQRLQKFYNPTLYKAPPKKEMTMEEKIISAGSFVQVSEHRVEQPAPAPEIFSGSYEKKGEKSGGVMGLMDMLVKELEGDMKDAEYGEKTAQKEYADLMAESETTRAQDTKTITDKESAKANLEGKLTDAKASKSLTFEKLEEIQNYIQDLHMSCDFIMENFDMRKEARTNESESLKNAKAVLAGAGFGR